MKNCQKNVNCQVGLQASYISSSLACVFEVLVVKGGRWKKSEAGRVKRARRLRREKKWVCADSRFSNSLPALIETVIKQTT